MHQQEVEAVIRSVIRDYGVPMNVMGVARIDACWSIEVTGGGQRLTMTLSDSSPHTLRRSAIPALDMEG